MPGLKIRMKDSYRPERSYICHVVFSEFLQIDYSLEFVTDSEEEYSIIAGDHCVSFPDILFNTHASQWLKQGSWPTLPLPIIPLTGDFFDRNFPAIYSRRTADGGLSLLDVDYLGSIFFLLTRYEEIETTKEDEFGRYAHEQSMLFKTGLLKRAVVNEYIEVLKFILKEKFPGLVFKRHQYTLSLSHDVDVPITLHMPARDYMKKSVGDLYYRKSGRLITKRFVGKVHHLLTGKFSFDPNYNFRFLADVEADAGIKGLFNFIPVKGPLDVDSKYDINSPLIQNLFATLHDEGFGIGFHPSFQSFENLEQTRAELISLNTALAKLGIPSVTKGRQHYLRWKNPVTWKIWNELGMKEDSSVGYGKINGFRSSCCYKYSVFDLLERRHLSLVEEPLIVMDVNCNIDSDLDTIKEEVRYYAAVCRYFNGNLLQD